MGIYVSSTGFRLLISKIYDLFLQVGETTTAQEAMRSSSESLANTSVSEKVSYEIN